MIKDLNYGVQEVTVRTINEGREFGKVNADGGFDIYVQANCVIYANESINFTIHVTNPTEYENFKDLIQPQVDKFVADMKILAAEQGVPYITI